MILTKTETEVFKRLCKDECFNAISFLGAVTRARKEGLPPEWIFRKMNSKTNKEKLRELNRLKCVQSKDLDKGFNQSCRVDIDDFKDLLADNRQEPCNQLLRKEGLKELGQRIKGDYETSKALLVSCLKRNTKTRQFSESDLTVLTPFLNQTVLKRFFDRSIPFYR